MIQIYVRQMLPFQMWLMHNLWKEKAWEHREYLWLTEIFYYNSKQ